MLTGVPLVHAGQYLVALVDGDDRAFGQGIEVAVGDDGGHFDDDVVVRVQTGHFQVDPDQVLWVLHGGLLGVAAQSSVADRASIPPLFTPAIIYTEHTWPNAN